MSTEQITPSVEVPHQIAIPMLQKWRSFGTGVGIEVCPDELRVTLSVVRPGGIKVVDTLEIPRYRERPAAEWGSDYQAFLKKHKLTHVSAAVVLPASDCVSRVIALPGVGDRELAAAVQYQLDGLHPFSEEEATHSFARLSPPRQANVSLAISKRPVVEDYATLFDEAGIAVVSFLTPAAAIYSALRTLQLAPANQFLAIHEDASGLLLYGESESHPLYCVRFPLDSDRAIASASAQMRLPEDAPQARLAALLPVADKLDSTGPVAYAASLASALPSQAIAVNLLPADRRKTSSPLRWVPTIVLVVMLMVLGLGFAYYQDYENRRLLEKLDAELARLQPRVSSVRLIDTQIGEATRKLAFLSKLATNPQEDLDTLRELTRIMPMSAYVSRLDMTRTDVGLVGEIDQSLELLKMLDSSLYFKDSEFSSAPGRLTSGKELFQIRTRRETPAAARAAVAGPNVAVPAPAPVINSTPLPRIAPPPPLPQGFRP
jgi:hypothetical protein